jgi:hypothetical protein
VQERVRAADVSAEVEAARAALEQLEAARGTLVSERASLGLAKEQSEAEAARLASELCEMRRSVADAHAEAQALAEAVQGALEQLRARSAAVQARHCGGGCARGRCGGGGAAAACRARCAPQQACASPQCAAERLEHGCARRHAALRQRRVGAVRLDSVR